MAVIVQRMLAHRAMSWLCLLSLMAVFVAVQVTTLREIWVGDYLCQARDVAGFAAERAWAVAATILLFFFLMRLQRSWLLVLPAILILMQGALTMGNGNWHDCDRKGCEGCMISIVITSSVIAIAAIAVLVRETVRVVRWVRLWRNDRVDMD